MENIKTKAKISNMLLNGICKLRTVDLQDSYEKIRNSCNKCMEIINAGDLLNEAVKRSWIKGAEIVKARINAKLPAIIYQLGQLKESYSGKNADLPKVADIFNELTATQQEFGQLKLDTANKTISIVTDNIVLEEVSLGPFEIKLFIDNIKSLHAESPYRVIALEPNCAGVDDNVTHPHVSNERLCEGDGYLPIRNAIKQGRIFDFFTLIVNILNTYNPDSPYVSIYDWQGHPCYNCDYTLDRENSYYCEYCDHDFCESCSSYCQQCDTTICLGCGGQCSSCSEFICPSCIKKCIQCDTALCENCIEEDLCPTCISERDTYEEYEETDTEVLADSMGETSLHA